MAYPSPSERLRSRLRQALSTAMKAGDPIAVAAFRSAVAAIDNAEAADLSDAPAVQHGAIAGGVAGLGAGEVPRRSLSEGQLVELMLAEIAARQTAAADYEHVGRHDQAMRLQGEASILAEFLADGNA